MATLLVVENREPHRYTALESEGDVITRFGGEVSRPLLYTGVCILSPRLLDRISEGEASLVEDVWKPMLLRGEQIGYVRHDGEFADLGRPEDFLHASLEALARGGPFPAGAGTFDEKRRVLSHQPVTNFEARACTLGRAEVAAGAQILESVVWDAVEIGAEARIERCLAAGGRIQAGARHTDALLWPGAGGDAAAHPLEASLHGFHARSPRR